MARVTHAQKKAFVAKRFQLLARDGYCTALEAMQAVFALDGLSAAEIQREYALAVETTKHEEAHERATRRR